MEQLAAMRRELALARADNAALHRRLAQERSGHLLQLECTVAHWTEMVNALKPSDSTRIR